MDDVVDSFAARDARPGSAAARDARPGSAAAAATSAAPLKGKYGWGNIWKVLSHDA